MNPTAQPPKDLVNLNVIGAAFDILKAKWQTFVVGGLLYVVVVGVIITLLQVVIFASLMAKGGIIISLLMIPVIQIVMFVIGAVFQSGMVNMAIKASRNEPFELSDLWWGTKNIGPTLIAGLIMGVLVGIGMMLCYIPGILLSGLLMMTWPLMIDQGYAPMDAIKKSIDVMKPYMVMAAVVWFVLALVSGLGAIACGIGVIFTMPILFIGQALIYREMRNAGAI